MASDCFNHKQEDDPMQIRPNEQEILGQVAKLLVRENLMKPEEQLRFLAFLKGEL